MSALLVRAFGLWLVILILAIGNAGIREKILEPQWGSQVALPVSGVLLSLLIFMATFILVPYFGSVGRRGYILIGSFWLLLTLGFEFLFGYFVVGKSWSEIMEVFDVRNGDFFVVALLATFVAPWGAARWRGII